MAEGWCHAQRGNGKNKTQPTTVNYENLKNAFVQGEEREAATLMNEILRRCVRGSLLDLMAEEVEALCGPRYKPDPESDYRRAGNSPVNVFVDDQKEQISRPRVRTKSGEEVELVTHQIAASPQRIFDQVVSGIEQGLPIRGSSRAVKGSISKSEASRMWVERSREQLAELRNRKLDEQEWLAVLIDGVFLKNDLCVVVALGIDREGGKQVLDFEEGPSENATVAKALLSHLAERGLQEPEDRRLLVLRDGSKALAKAVSRHWPRAIQQECLVHVHRTVRDQVRKRDRADLDLKFKQLRDAQGKKAGQEAFEDLLDFVSERNAASAINLEKRKDALLSFHRLEVPSTLNVTFLSTNLIENMLRNWREATGNIKRWNESEDMVSRWMASGLLWAEAGFRKIAHYKDLPKLQAALALAPTDGDGVATPNPAELSQLDHESSPPKSPQGDFAPPVPPVAPPVPPGSGGNSDANADLKTQKK